MEQEQLDDIREDFLTRRAEIDALDQALASERRAIQDNAADDGRLMNAEEKQRRKDIGATRQELAEALEALALATLDRLNNNGEIAALNSELERVNQMLEDDLENLKQKEEYAEAAAKVMAGLATAAAKVASHI